MRAPILSRGTSNLGVQERQNISNRLGHVWSRDVAVWRDQSSFNTTTWSQLGQLWFMWGMLLNALSSHIAFIAVTLLLLTPSVWARYAFSAKNFSTPKLLLTLAYNVFCGHLYLKYAKYGTLPFDITLRSIELRWLALFIPLAFALLLPTPRIKTGTGWD